MTKPHITPDGRKSDLPPGWETPVELPPGGVKIEDLKPGWVPASDVKGGAGTTTPSAAPSVEKGLQSAEPPPPPAEDSIDAVEEIKDSSETGRTRPPSRWND